MAIKIKAITRKGKIIPLEFDCEEERFYMEAAPRLRKRKNLGIDSNTIFCRQIGGNYFEIFDGDNLIWFNGQQMKSIKKVKPE